MEDRMRALALLLERMFVLYERVYDLLDTEKKSLILTDFDSLLNTLREKDEVLAALRALDKDRIRIQDQFAVIERLPFEQVTLKTIAESLQENSSPALQKQGEQLLYLRGRLSELIAHIQDKIQSNKYFTEASIKTLQGLAEEISDFILKKPLASNGTSKKASQVYTGKAKMSQSSSKTGTLVEKRY